MKRIKVIGIGSPFGQDQLGWQVIDQLRHNLADQIHGRQIKFIQSDRPGLRLLDLVKDTDMAILIDAIDNKECAGEILKLDRTELLNTDQTLSSHAIGVSEALSLGAVLGELPEELVLFAMCVDGSDPQPTPHAQLTQMCQRISEYLAFRSQPKRRLIVGSGALPR